MKLFKQTVILLGILLMLAACQDEATGPMATPDFFDLKSFFEQEIIRLEKVNKVLKKATVNGKVEEKTVEGIDFKAELNLFIDSDINKISLMDRYDVDSVFNKTVLTKVIYQAKDERLKTNRLIVNYNRKDIESIEITRKTSSIAAEMEQNLSYTPLKGYTIKSMQQTSLSDPHVLRLDVQFVK